MRHDRSCILIWRPSHMLALSRRLNWSQRIWLSNCRERKSRRGRGQSGMIKLKRHFIHHNHRRNWNGSFGTSATGQAHLQFGIMYGQMVQLMRKFIIGSPVGILLVLRHQLAGFRKRSNKCLGITLTCDWHISIIKCLVSDECLISIFIMIPPQNFIRNPIKG